MLFEQLVRFILRSRWNALAIAFFLSALPFMSWGGAVVVALVTLRLGGYEGFSVLAVSALPSVIFYALGSPEHFFYSFLAGNLATYILAIILREFASWRFTLQIGCILAIAGITIVYIVFPTIHLYWLNIFNFYYAEAKTALQLKLGVKDLTPIFQIWASFATGVQASMLLFICITNLMLARWLQSIAFNPSGFLREILELRLDYASLLCLVIFIFLGYYSANAFRDYIPVLLTLFFIAGISLFHWVLVSRRLSWIWAIGYYLLLCLVPQVIVPITVILAMIDSVMDIRTKLRAIYF